MGYPIQQSQTAQPLEFLMVDSTDHLTGKTGLSPTVTISKNGAAFASPAGAVTEIGVGWYKVAGNATDANTLGPLILHATGTGADPTDDRFDVVAYNPQDATALGLSRLDAAVTTRASQTSLDTVDDLLDTEVAAIAAFVDTEVAAIKAKTDQLVFTTANRVDSTPVDKTGYKLASDGLDTVAAPATLANDAAGRASFMGMIRHIHARFYNLVTQTATQQKVHNDAGTVISTSTVSDDGTTQQKLKSS